MARITGTNGVVKSGATIIGSVTEFSLEETADIVPDDVLGVLTKNFVVDRTGWTGSITVSYDKDDTAQGTMTVGAALSLALIPGGETSGNETFTGNVIVTGRSTPVAAGAMVSRSYPVQGTGALAEGTVV